MLQKLSLSDLTCVSGGQIYEFFDKEKGSYCYLVPSAAGFTKYDNKTAALDHIDPFAKKGIVPCASFKDAEGFAKTDRDAYRFVEALNNGGRHERSQVDKIKQRGFISRLWRANL